MYIYIIQIITPESADSHRAPSPSISRALLFMLSDTYNVAEVVVRKDSGKKIINKQKEGSIVDDSGNSVSVGVVCVAGLCDMVSKRTWVGSIIEMGHDVTGC